ncbi:MAG: hemolysin hemolytic protein [Prevotella sp.]|nr:hemolysin hemolytic protein [Prevotella sp.]MCI7496066.1 hemolysin hemolytic protein [Prevotella sp.]
MNKNLGCAMGVKTAIDWIFETEKYGIILEDDCVVSKSFFPFMEDILVRYKDDQRIGMVAGTNPIEKYRGRTSFHFSRFKSCWGWATWARAWKNMDMDMTWRETDMMSVINNSGFNSRHNSKWHFQLKCIDRNHVSAWDWQWYFSLAAQNQLCVYPAVNLVSNIGNDIEATHTSFGDITRERHELPLPLTAPSIVAPDYHFDKMFDANENRLTTMLARITPHTLKGYIKRLINR